VIGDVAAFYEYVDHARLADEIVELTGELDLADAISLSLSELTGRAFGLPQGPRASDAFASFYLTRLDRRLARLGTTAFRYHDEFRLPVIRAGDAPRVLLELEEELRQLGLVLNPAKTRVVSRTRYEGALDALESRLEEARESAASDLDIYGFDPDAFAGAEWGDLPTDHLEEAFVGAATETPSRRDSVSDRLIAQFLPLLAAAESQVVLEQLADLVRRRTWLTRSISLYLRSLAGTDSEEAMVKAVDGVLRSRTYLLPWVRGWLVDPLVHCQSPLPKPLLRHIQATFASPKLPSFARARAGLVLATESALPSRDAVVAVFDIASPGAQADVVAAVAHEEPDWGADFLRSVAESPILANIPAVVAKRGLLEVI
jgi:hypothetical protein